VILRPGLGVAPADLIAFCVPRLAYVAIPRYLEFVDALPLTANGKIKKFVLRARGVGPRTWDRDQSGVELEKPSR
jgi:crotonobetaine/carnitine-CoA ligase